MELRHSAPLGLEPAAPALPAQGRTGDRGEASREPRPARPREVHAVTSVGATYTGRFAPSPTGPLHAGSLVAALASWLDARAWNLGQGGRWLVRIEDLDTLRNMRGATELILQQLQACALVPDEAPVFQSQRTTLYQQALVRLVAAGRVYPCGCSRKDLTLAHAQRGTARARHAELVYPGTCRNGLHGKPAVAWRFCTEPEHTATATAASGTNPATPHAVTWCDRRLGPQKQDVAAEVGDFVVRRADGPFAYQLAVVVDDAAQQVTHIVRGEDLADNTARQLLLQGALALQPPQYLHTPLVLASDGAKLSKQNGAVAIDTSQPVAVLNAAAATLALPPHHGALADALASWVTAWRHLYNPAL